MTANLHEQALTSWNEFERIHLLNEQRRELRYKLAENYWLLYGLSAVESILHNLFGMQYKWYPRKANVELDLTIHSEDIQGTLRSMTVSDHPCEQENEILITVSPDSPKYVLYGPGFTTVTNLKELGSLIAKRKNDD